MEQKQFFGIPYELISNSLISVYPEQEFDLQFTRALQEITNKFFIQLTKQCIENKSLVDNENRGPLDFDDLMEGLKNLNLNEIQPTSTNIRLGSFSTPTKKPYDSEDIFKERNPSLFKINQGPSKNVKNWIQENPDVDLNVCFGNALLFKRLVACIKESGIQYEVNFEFSPETVTIQSLGPQNVSLLSVHLRASAFDDYQCPPHGVTLGIHLTALEQYLKGASKSDQLTLLHTRNSKRCTLFLEDPYHRFQIFHLRLKSFDFPFRLPETPSEKYTAEISIPSQVFQRVFRDLKSNLKGDDLLIKISKFNSNPGRISFQGEGTFGDVEIVLDEPLVNVQTEEKFKGTLLMKFSVSFLARFARAPLAEMVKIHAGEDVALLCCYEMEGIGDVEYYLAPKKND